MPFPIAAAAQVAAPLIGGLANIGRGRREHRRNLQSQTHAHNLNLQAFDYQNAYNTPKNQVARLKDAGLNTALAYGQATTGNATGVPQVQPVNRSVDKVDVSQLLQGAAQGVDTLLKEQQNRNLEATQKETESRTVLNTIEAAVKGGTQKEAKGLIRSQLQNLQADTRQKAQNLKNSLVSEKLLNQNFTKAQIDTENSRIQKELNRLDLDHVTKSGLSRLEPTIVKVAWRLAQKGGASFKQLIEFMIKKNTQFGDGLNLLPKQ